MNRRNIITLFLLVIVFAVHAQSQNTINVNPDPNGTPCFLDGYKPIPKEQYLSLDEVIQLRNQTAASSNTSNSLKSALELPASIDNSQQPYMRPVFSQVGGSCGSSSRICYMFAYEINCYRRVPGDLQWNMYPSHFTWLLTGQGSSKEGMAKANGIPNAVTYGGDRASNIYGGKNVGWPSLDGAPDYGWMQGYDKWYKAMNNRIEKSTSFHISGPKALNLLKEWFFNHWGDNSFPAGGIAGAGCAINAAQYVRTTNGKWMVKKWGPKIDHGTTWVGYDDNIAYDFNGDGKITNNIDTNGDGKVNFKDWERGALIMRNSWGDWMNNGNVYVPYRLMDQHAAELYFIRKDYTPRRTMKIVMNYNARSEIKISVGVSDDLNATSPKRTMECEHFKFAGNGKVPMLGKWEKGGMHTEDMEFGYDITDLTKGFDATKPLKYFLKIETKQNASGAGRVKSMSVLNYDNYVPIETESDQHDVAIANKGKTTYVSVVMQGGKPIHSRYLPNNNWKVVDFDSEEPKDKSFAKYAIDGNPNTMWHTQWAGYNKPYPHYIVVDMGSEQDVSEFNYLPRQTGNQNGTVKEYELYLSNDGKNWGEPVAKGSWKKDEAERNIKFAKTKARYFKFVAISEINGNPWASAAELRFLNNNVPSMYVDKTKWRVIDFDAQNDKDQHLAIHAINGDASMIWDTKCSSEGTELPHHITVDMGEKKTLSVFEYIPRQDKFTRGMVADFQLYLSNDPNNWGEPVAEGTWDNSHDAKIVSFKKKTARYFKFVALSEVYGRKCTSVADLRFWNNESVVMGIEDERVLKVSDSQVKIWATQNNLNIYELPIAGKVYIINLQGQILISKFVQQGNNRLSINLDKGIYIVKVLQDNGKIIAQKVIIR